MNAGAVIVGRQNRYLRRFLNAGVTEPGHARTLEQLGCRRSFVFRRMVRAGVFVEVSGGRYYIDVSRAKAFRFRRRMTLLSVAVVTVIALLILLATR